MKVFEFSPNSKKYVALSNPCVVLTCEIFSKDLSFSFFSWKSEDDMVQVYMLNKILIFVPSTASVDLHDFIFSSSFCFFCT